MALADELPEGGIVEAKKRLGTGASIWEVGPGISIEEGHIPLNAAAEFRVVTGLGAAHGAIGNMKIEHRMAGHRSKQGRGILHRMGSDDQYAEAALRHGTASTK